MLIKIRLILVLIESIFSKVKLELLFAHSKSFSCGTGRVARNNECCSELECDVRHVYVQ